MALEMLNPAGQAPQSAPPEAAPVGQPPVDPIQVSMEEAKKNRKMLDASIDRMRNSLEKRNKAPFDPMLMRIAAEAGKPTKTGSFYESLGNVAGGVLDQHASDQKLRQENELKLEELIQKSALMRNKQLALDASGRIVQGGGPGVGAGLGGKTGANAPGRFITAEDIQRISLIDSDVGERLMKLGEYNLKHIKETKDGIYDIRNPNQPIVLFEQPAVETTLPGIGNYKVTPAVRKRAEAVIAEGRDKRWTAAELDSALAQLYFEERIGNEFVKPAPGMRMGKPNPSDAGAASATAGAAAGAPAGGAPSADGPTLLSPRDVKRRDEFNAGDIAEGVKARADVAADLEKNRKLAEIIKPLAQRSINFANSKDGQAVLGQIAGSPNLAQRFADLISQGVNTPTGSISAPAIGEFMTLLNAPEGQINAYQGIVQNAAEFAVQFAKLFSGQGAISDTERTMINRLPPSPRDTPVVYSFKANMLQARTVLDTKRAEAYKQWRNKPDNKEKSGNDYFDSPEDKRLIANYDKWTDHTWHNFFGEPLIPRGQSGKPGQKVGNLESQVR